MRSPSLLLSTLLFMFSAPLLAQPGTLDHSFNSTGIRVLSPGVMHDRGYDVLPLPGGAMLICGSTNFDGTAQAFVSRISVEGSVDLGFGTDLGNTYINAGGGDGYGFDMALTSDGKIVGCGVVYPTIGMAEVLVFRLLANGQPDASFGTDGYATAGVTGVDAEGQGVAVQADGRIVVGGSAGSGSRDVLLVRFTADGDLDPSFSGDGMLMMTGQAEGGELWDIGLLGNGNIIGVGHTSVQGDAKTLLVQVTGDGTPLTSFGGDGELVASIGTTTDNGNALIVAGAEFYVAGWALDVPGDQDTYVAKFNTAGALVTGYGTGGVAIGNSDDHEVLYDLAMQTDGKIVTCGTSGASSSGPRDFLVRRYTTAGQPDATFGTSGATITSIRPDADEANAIAITTDGKILLAGYTAGTSYDVAVARYLGDGTAGIEEGALQAAALRSYPVPTDGGTWGVRVGRGVPAPVTITLLDAAGRALNSPLRITLNEGMNALPSAWFQGAADGVYHLRIATEAEMSDLPVVLVH